MGIYKNNNGTLEKYSGGLNEVDTDDVLSLTSTNPIQNKVVTEAINSKVDKMDGKNLSSNDFTDDDKTKLSGIEEGANKTVVDSELSAISENPVQNKVVYTEIEALKKSVSDGKTSVANAITAKGITTATNATFATMATNIAAIETGGGMSLNVFTQETEPETKDGVWIQTANPFTSVVVGSTTYSNAAVGEWSPVSTLPYSFYMGSAVVYNNEIHILGGGESVTNHYKFNGSTWSSVSTLPYSFYRCSAVVYNNEIHILGGAASKTNHYKFNGSTWSSVSTLPYEFYNGSAVVYNNEIHILGGSGGKRNHYKFNGSTWTSVSTLLNDYYGCAAVVLTNNQIVIIGNDYGNYCRFNGSTWFAYTQSHAPYGFVYGSAVTYNNEIHILGTAMSGVSETLHYKGDDYLTWSSVSTLPYEFRFGSAVVYNNEIHILGGSGGKRNHYVNRADTNTTGSKVAIYQNPSNATGTHAANFISGSAISGENNKFPSGFDDVFYVDSSGNVEEAPTYYGDGTQWIKFKN